MAQLTDAFFASHAILDDDLEDRARLERMMREIDDEAEADAQREGERERYWVGVSPRMARERVASDLDTPIHPAFRHPYSPQRGGSIRSNEDTGGGNSSPPPCGLNPSLFRVPGSPASSSSASSMRANPSHSHPSHSESAKFSAEETALIEHEHRRLFPAGTAREEAFEHGPTETDVEVYKRLIIKLHLRVEVRRRVADFGGIVERKDGGIWEGNEMGLGIEFTNKDASPEERRGRTRYQEDQGTETDSQPRGPESPIQRGRSFRRVGKARRMRLESPSSEGSGSSEERGRPVYCHYETMDLDKLMAERDIPSERGPGTPPPLFRRYSSRTRSEERRRDENGGEGPSNQAAGATAHLRRIISELNEAHSRALSGHLDESARIRRLAELLEEECVRLAARR